VERLLENRTAIVLGAGSIGPGWGNGKATACQFARAGATVMCVDINIDAAEETAGMIRGEGGKAEAHRADVTRPSEVEGLVQACLDRYGRLDVLCNNVGIAEVGGVVELPLEEWDRVFKVNLTSCFLAMKYALPRMVEAGSGSIINISSIASLRYTGVAYASYSASKAAMNHLTQTTAVEYAGRGIRVNVIAPGLMKTPMVEHSKGLASNYGAGDIEAMWAARAAQVPMKRMGDAWDVAKAALFLASDDSRYITGVCLPVDGGITLKIS
jgi:NAD(P)-dependent dehydrogenase (short-subunit alcohol dehydrogenase family)